MRLTDTFKLCLKNLQRSKSRSLVTIIGVIIGSGAIIIMTSLGFASAETTTTMLNEWGDLTLIDVFNNINSNTLLDDEQVRKIQEIEHIVAVSPFQRISNYQGSITTGVNGRYKMDNLYTSVAVDFASLGDLGYKLVEGSIPTEISTSQNIIPVLAFETAAFSFGDTSKAWNHPDYYRSAYNDDGILDTTNSFFKMMSCRLKLAVAYDFDDEDNPITFDYDLVVVGVLETDSDRNKGIDFLIPSSSLTRLERDYSRLANEPIALYSATGYDQLIVRADDIENAATVERQINKAGFETSSLSKVRDNIQLQVAQSQIALGSLAAVSLLVAALNISNTMTMAINERVKEIGVLKTIGCPLPSIRALFLFEAGTLGLLGGFFGSILSIFLSHIMNNFNDIVSDIGIETDFSFVQTMFGLSDYTGQLPDAQVSIVPFWLIVFTILFSTVIGFISGIGPSNKAIRISPMEAIRRE